MKNVRLKYDDILNEYKNNNIMGYENEIKMAIDLTKIFCIY